MALEIKVGPPQLVVHQGYAFMVSFPDGQIDDRSDMGLYFLDTRLINSWAMFADGDPWKMLSGGALDSCAGRIFFTNPQIQTADGPIPENTLGLAFGRHIDGGLREDFEIRNFGSETARFNLELAIRSDFADLFEVKAKKMVRRGSIKTDWTQSRGELVTTYRNGDFKRALKVTAADADSKMSYANGRLTFHVIIKPTEIWRSSLLYSFADGDQWTEPPRQSVAEFVASGAVRDRKEWEDSVLKIDTSNNLLRKTFKQAIRDMSALRLPIEGTDEMQFVPAAGLPWFVALFGRDSLVISLQTSIVHPEFACGALSVLARWQARERDDYRDAEPGKIHHELRRGELAHFRLIPHTPYYGTADATPLYLITLHAAWKCSGNPTLLHRHLETAERCLEWIDRYGDRDGDGFQEYQTRSKHGYENQGWKDSGDAVMYPDGRLVKGPKALCELQGYVYDAWLRMAQIYDALGRGERALELRGKAAALFEKFNDAFWNEDEGFYAYALDGDKEPVLSIASNAGHCLWSGIIPPDRARRVANRLFRPDMWSGWGIRTLSADHPSFNPFNYQTGSVWPHDNAFIGLGLKRYGFHRETCEIAEAILLSAKYFAMDQLPELYAGVQRELANFPIQYLGANVPQGWAAGSVFMLLRAMLGLQPDAPNGVVYVDPVLPDWLPDLTIRDLRIGERAFDIRFGAGKDGTWFDVIRGDATRVRRRPMTETLVRPAPLAGAGAGKPG